MENKLTNHFDLTLLMEKSDLNIRRVAAVSKNLTAGGYFDMLSELIHCAPAYAEDLRKLVNRDGDRNTYKSLAGMFSLLKSLGYEKHLIDFDGVLDAYDRGQSRLSSGFAKNIIDDFEELCARVTAARITGQHEAFNADPYAISLKEWIERRYMYGANKKPVILAVDDSPMILKSVSSLLGDDYKVYMLAKSSMLERTLSQITPDLFLLDYNMPGINGFELIPIIRSFTDHKETPIIFLTSEGTIDTISSAVMLGACDFIAKPVRPDVLRERIAKHIGKDNELREKVS